MIKIETERLLIREHNMEDLNDYHAWISDPAVMRYVAGFRVTRSIEESLASLTAAIESRKEIPRKKYFAALARKDTGQYIGSIGGMIDRLEKNGGIMGIGYFLNKDYWRNGYASEAAKAWIDYSFDSLCVHRIAASCDSENAPSERVMLNCGMKKEAELTLHRYQNGRWRNELQYAIVREERTRDREGTPGGGS